MEDNMLKKQSLLITPKPYSDESLAGYILRLTEENLYKKINQIYLIAGLWKTVQRRGENGNLLNPIQDNMESLSELMNCSISDLIKLTFASNKADSPNSFQFNSQSIPRQAIHTAKQNIPLSLVAEKLNTSSKSLYLKLFNKGILALTRPAVDGGAQYLYKRA